jgi:hypothetical protein
MVGKNLKENMHCTNLELLLLVYRFDEESPLITAYSNVRSHIYIVLQLERGKLYCTRVDERVNELSLGAKEYMKNLVPVEEMEQAAASSDVMSRSSMTQLPAVDQVRTLLREGMLNMKEEWAVLRFELHVAFLEGGALRYEIVQNVLFYMLFLGAHGGAFG